MPVGVKKAPSPAPPARILSARVPCRGCYGPAPAVLDHGAKFLSALASIIDSKDPKEIEASKHALNYIALDGKTYTPQDVIRAAWRRRNSRSACR